MFKRAYELRKLVRKGKALVIYGPRQVGKTTLVEEYIAQIKGTRRVRYVTGDDIEIMDYLSSRSERILREFVSGYDILIIDEAQKIPYIGQSLKIIIDRIKGVDIIITGSASLELAGQVGEPLTGRKRTCILYPLSIMELRNHYNISELRLMLDDILVYGLYPEVINNKDNAGEKTRALKEILNSYLLKDVLELENVKAAKVLVDLLRLLAFQIGNEVSLSEIGKAVGLNKKTVARYIDILEKAFVLYGISAYSQNLRKEITKKRKYYFYDVGLRNMLIGNMNPISLRNDIGQIWENFVVMERIKRNTYKEVVANYYFWRTYNKSEIDWIEQREGRLFAYEIKYAKKKARPPKQWSDAYPSSEYKLITRDNFEEFVL